MNGSALYHNLVYPDKKCISTRAFTPNMILPKTNVPFHSELTSDSIRLNLRAWSGRSRAHLIHRQEDDATRFPVVKLMPWKKRKTYAHMSYSM